MLSASGSKATVLVVDDDALSRELLAQLLKNGGFDVIATPAGERALLILYRQGDQIDWLVSKAALPGLVCGWILKDEYHRHHPDRPILMIAPPDPADARRSHTIFIPPASPMHVLEALQALTNPEPAMNRSRFSGFPPRRPLRALDLKSGHRF